MKGISIFHWLSVLFILLALPAKADVIENLSGELFVNSGSVGYNLPLSVPPGINGLQPNINVVYSASGSASNMGSGFSLKTGASINRCTASIRKDGYFAGIEKSANTRFCRGTDKLVLVSGTNAASGSEYRTYLDKNSRLIANGGNQFTPDSWTEKTPDGYTLSYTKSPLFDANNAQWLLTTKEDAFGNEVTYQYKKTGQPLIEGIAYNGTQITINYENRARAILGYEKGSDATLDKRIQSVSITFNGAEAWSYRFAYELVGRATLEQDRLENITKCYGASGNDGCTKPLAFQYEAQPANTSPLDRPEDRTLVIPRSFYTHASFEDESPWDRPSYAKADLNNDGYPEFCYYKPGSGVLCAEYNGGSYDLPTSWSGDLGYAASTSNYDQYSYFGQLNFIDLNDDSYVDLCFVDDKGVRCALNQNGTSFSGFSYWNTALVSENGVTFEKLTDDNKPEFCGLRKADNVYTCYENTGTSAINQYFQLDNSISFDRAISWREVDFSDSNDVYVTKTKEISYKAPFWIDIDADLDRDICWIDSYRNLACKLAYRNTTNQSLQFSAAVEKLNFSDLTVFPSPSSTEIYSFSDSIRIGAEADIAIEHAKLLKTSLRIADINGDNNIDICYVDSSRDYKCHLNTGVGFEPSTTWMNLSALPEDDALYQASLATLSFSDENYDGLADLCSLHEKYRWCGLNTASSFLAFEPVLSISPDFDYNQETSRHYDNFVRSLFGMKTTYRVGAGASSYGVPITTGDINGDGFAEFCYRSIHGVICTDLDNFKPTHTLVGITDSFGQQTDINYGAYLADGLYDQSVAMPAGYIKKLSERQLVESVISDSGAYENGNAIRNTVLYRYGHMALNKSISASGFSHLIVENSDRNQKTVSTIYLDPDLSGQEKHIKQYVSDVLVNEKINTVSKRISGWDTVQILVNNVLETQYDLAGVEVSQNSINFDAYDDYGFVTQQTQLKTQAGETLQITSNNVFSNNTASWFLGLPTSNTVTHSDSNGSVVTRSVSFTYENGMPKTETIAPGDEDQQIITYTYNASGLPERVATTANGETRYITKEYDSFGRLTLLSNALGQEETYSYDRWCGVSSVTDIAGRIKTTTYDALCQKTSSSNSVDSNRTTWSIDWSADISRNLIGMPTEVRNPAVYKITETSAFGAKNIAYFDVLGRKIRSAQKTTASEGGERFALQDTIYDRFSRTIASTKPYFEINGSPSTPLWSSMEYDIINRPVSETKNGPNGLPMTINTVYDANSSTQSYSDYTKVTVSGIHGKPVSITENDLMVAYTYNAIGELIETNRDGQLISLQFDGRGQKSKQIDPSMGTWDYDYNGFGELIWQKDAKGQVTTFDYDALGRLITRVDAQGETTYIFNDAGNGIGQVASESSPGVSRSFHYDASGRISDFDLVIDGNTFTTAYTYDVYSRLLTTQHPDGLVIRNNYDEVGAIKTFSMPSADFQDYNYAALQDESDALVASIAQLQLQIHALEQAALGHTVKATYYRDQVSYFTRLYDSANAQVAELETIAAQHDDQAKALYLQAADMRAEAQAVLDKIGDSSKTSMKYTGVVNGEYEFKRDWCSRRKKNWHRLSSRCVAREYRTIKLTRADLNPSDAANPIYLFNSTPTGWHKPHEAWNNAAKAWDQLAEVQTEKAKAARDLLNGPDTVSVYMPKVEQHQTWVLIGVEIPVPVEVTVTTRDKQWQQVSLDTAIDYYAQQRNYFQGLLNSEGLKKDAVVADISSLAEDLLEAQNAYDFFESNLESLNVNAEDLGDIVAYREQWQAENKQLVIWMATARNAAGQVQSELFGNGLFTQTKYNDDSGAVTDIVTGTYSGHTMRHLEYEYNDRGLVESKSDTTTQGNVQSETFDYDTQGRLTDWQFDQTLTGATQTKIKSHGRTYDYDDWGNITFKTGAGTMNYDADTGRLISREIDAQTLTYSYDDNGNMLNGDGRSYTWTAFNKVASVSSGQIVNFTYGANQKRVSKQVGNSTTYYVSPGYEVTIEAGGQTRHRHNIVVGDDVVATYERLEDATQSSDQVVYYHRDMIGSGEMVTGSGMEVLSRRYYTPYGETLADVLDDDDTEIIQDGAEALIEVDENYKEQILAQVQAEDTLTLLSEIQVRDSVLLENLRGYTSHENVTEVGLINMNARLYDPTIARFVSADTMVPGIDQPLAYNRYAYVSGNPVSYRDPSGHFFIPGLGPVDNLFIDASIQDNPDYQMVANIAVATTIAMVVGPQAGGGVQGAMAAASVSSLSMSFLSKGEITAEDVVNAGIAAASAAVTYGIGNNMGFEQYSWQQYTAHAISQGAFAHIRGGKFIDGAVAGLAGKAAGHITSEVDLISGRGHIVTRTMISGSMGWLAAKATSGNAPDAFLAAATVHLFNAESGLVFRALNKDDRARLDKGLGLVAKNPHGDWSAEEHVEKGSQSAAYERDPWISTTTQIQVTKGYDDGHGVVAIDLSKVETEIVTYKTLGSVWANNYNFEEKLIYHRSVWSREVLIHGYVPREAITPLY